MKPKVIRGVNLGGWLVLEKWITPSVFQGTLAIDELGLCKELGSDPARQRLEEHRRTFITKRDVQAVKELGLNTLRVPVGYWLFKDVDGFVGGSYRYLDRLFRWAEQYDLYIIISIHGAPGSQNGWDHSGQSGVVGWGKTTNNIIRTLRFITRLSERYGQKKQLIGIEILNEPHPILPFRVLMRYYKRALSIIRSRCHDGAYCIVSDAFRPGQTLLQLLVYGLWRRVVLDRHMYQVFNEKDQRLNFTGHMKKAKCWRWRVGCLSLICPVIVGEWSAAMVGGYAENQYEAYASAQRKSFEKAHCGWVYWTIRTEEDSPWNLLSHSRFVK